MTEEILKKITKYNLFNYLLPGMIFVVFVSKTTELDLIKLFENDSIIFLFFLSYFIGAIISRIGSLLVEPFLKWLKFITFANYSDYLEAIKKDPKIDDLSEENNTYRTYISLFLMVLLLHLVIFLFEYFQVKNVEIIIPILLFVLFLFSYRKQTDYIRNRVNKN